MSNIIAMNLNKTIIFAIITLSAAKLILQNDLKFLLWNGINMLFNRNSNPRSNANFEAYYSKFINFQKTHISSFSKMGRGLTPRGIPSHS